MRRDINGTVAAAAGKLVSAGSLHTDPTYRTGVTWQPIVNTQLSFVGPCMVSSRAARLGHPKHPCANNRTPRRLLALQRTAGTLRDAGEAWAVPTRNVLTGSYTSLHGTRIVCSVHNLISPRLLYLRSPHRRTSCLPQRAYPDGLPQQAYPNKLTPLYLICSQSHLKELVPDLEGTGSGSHLPPRCWVLPRISVFPDAKTARSCEITKTKQCSRWLESEVRCLARPTCRFLLDFGPRSAHRLHCCLDMRFCLDR